MYYLVRDYYDETELKIFSDKNDIEEYIHPFEDGEMLLVYNWEQGQYKGVRNCKRIYFDQYFIIKKSENVFDFIDRDNDLLKISVLDISNVLAAKSINGSFRDMDNILAIYKTDKHGNYIKVWERSNENDR